MNKLFIVFALFAIASVSYAHDINDLAGEWSLVVCDEGLGCRFLFNLTMDFTIDTQSSSITNNIKFLNGFKNSYDTDEAHFTYAQKDEDTFTLTPSNGDPELTLIFYLNDTVGLYQVFNNPHNSHSTYRIFGIQRPDSINAAAMIGHLNETLPNFPFLVAGYESEKLPFQTSTNFKLGEFNSRIWYITAQWVAGQAKPRFTPKAPTQNYCYQALFVDDWEDGIGGLDSKYNFGALETVWSEDEIVTLYSWINYPDPVINSWIHSDGVSMGVVYADNTTLIIVDQFRNVATMYTANPLFSSVNFALFNAQIVKAGINPLNGQSNTYNNSLCDPSFFVLDDLIGSGNDSWVVSSAATTVDDPFKFRNLACLTAVFSYDNGDKTKINLDLSGYDLENRTSFQRTIGFTAKEGQERYLYPDEHPDSPFYITAFNGDSLMFVRSEGDKHEAFTFIRKLSEVGTMYNQFLLAPFFPGEVVELPYSIDQCEPPIPPAANITNAILSTEWHGLATYQGFFVPTNISCFQWSITNNTKFPAFLDIVATAYNDYTTMEYRSINSPVPDNNGYLIPQVTHFHADVFNNNKTELWLTVQHFDDNTMILVNDDKINFDAEFFILSKSTNYTPDLENLFKSVVQKYTGQFVDSLYQIV